MRNTLLSYLFIGIVFCSCKDAVNMPSPEAIKAEIVQAEAAFAKMANEEGLEKAFLHFAAEDAVLKRNDNLYKGKTEIQAFFQKQKNTNVKLNWKPDFVSVSLSGDMAYTYGPYTYEAMDSLEKIEVTGIFHTVWKRQADGSWKYVWD